MVTASIDPRSAAEVDAYLQATRKRIFIAVREGMQEAMDGLAGNVAAKLQGNPIVSRSGRLLAAVLGGVKVSENATTIFGRLFPDTHDGRNLAMWLEDGHDVPAVIGKLLHFFSGNGEIFIRGHQAFRVEAKPFLNPSLEEYSPTIMEIIAAKVADAVVD